MYKLSDTVFVSNMFGTNLIGYEFNQDYLTNCFLEDTGNRYLRTFKALKLKNNAEFIPIINALNSTSRVLNTPKDTFITRELANTATILMGSSNISTLDKVKDEIIVNLGSVYDSIVSMTASDFSSNIIIGGSAAYVCNLRVDTQQQILNSRNNTNYVMLDENSILGTFYYVSDNKILLTLMVKKEFIPEFKKNISDGLINPTHVEIWIDKSLLDEKERKKLHKWIRDVFLMKLVMNGFKIVEKEDIISELVYFPKIRFRSPSEISEFKTGISKLVLDE